jgi:hypothetical protein
MALSVTQSDPREICRQINESAPVDFLFEGDRARLHPDSRLPWRISPEPFWLTPEQHDVLLRLGPAIHAFNKACNLLYHQSVKGLQPAFVHEYLDAGKSERAIELARLNRVKSHLPVVLRPDLIITADGVRVAEFDSLPGGIGFTAQVTATYADIGFDVLGGADGLIDGFYEAVTHGLKSDPDDAAGPVVCIIVSDESDAYREEMVWLAAALRDRGKAVHCRHPKDLHVDDMGVLFDVDGRRTRADVAYRFFELFDLPNIPKVEFISYHVRKNAVRVTPPMKAFLEEKMWLALFHHARLRTFWDKELPRDSHELLRDIIPHTWVLDSTPSPPHTVIPDLQVGGRVVSAWDDLMHLSKKERELVIKPSGFTEDAQQSKGVTIGHDVSENDWQAALQAALQSFSTSPYVLQKFHKGARLPARYYDFDSEDIKPMHGRALLRPYYYVIGDDVRLAGTQCVLCPADKKILHGMIDAVLVPAAVREPASESAAI